MNDKIKNIVNKSDDVSLDQAEMIYVVEQYIKEKKSVDVKIELNMFNPFKVHSEIKRLNHAYNIAKAFYLGK